MSTIKFGKLFFWVMLIPSLLIYTFFFIAPALFTLILSFIQWSGFNSDFTFVGFGNYKKSFFDEVFWLSLRNTLYIIAIGGLSVFIISFFFSLVLTTQRKSSVFKSIVKSIVFLPFVVSVFASVNMWQNIYNPATGVIPIIEGLFNIKTNFIFTSPENILNSMLIALVWNSAGFYLIILLSGVDKIPQEMFEAAELEGASSWDKFYKITLPLIWDVVVICFTLWIILAIKNFEFPYAFGAQNIPQSLYNTSVYMYIKGFGQREPIFQMGYASAIGVESIVIAGILVMGVRRFLKREVSEL